MYTKQKESQNKARLVDFLKAAGIRATRQRLALAALLFDGKHKHLTAEQVHVAARQQKLSVSLATVYNNLHQFTAAGLLREVNVDQSHAFFDTYIGPHYHFFDERSGVLTDIEPSAVRIDRLPRTPGKRRLHQVDLILRLR